jgi:hypothetical protein
MRNGKEELTENHNRPELVNQCHIYFENVKFALIGLATVNNAARSITNSTSPLYC